MSKQETSTIKDLNKFNQNDAASQGLLNASLLTANASQLQLVIQSGFPETMFYVQLALLLISITLQVIQGILVLSKYKIDMETDEDKGESKQAHKYNWWAMVVATVLMAVNTLISTFGASLYTCSTYKAKAA
ncbi:ninjurin-1-like [Branchiostoma floridae x Branchiostoma belcheri]